MASPRARELRKTMTPQELKLWLRLRALGHHFRRQSPLKPYVVDFECRQASLVIEIDGDQHGIDEHRRRTLFVIKHWSKEDTRSCASQTQK